METGLDFRLRGDLEMNGRDRSDDAVDVNLCSHSCTNFVESVD